MVPLFELKILLIFNFNFLTSKRTPLHSHMNRKVAGRKWGSKLGLREVGGKDFSLRTTPREVMVMSCQGDWVNHLQNQKQKTDKRSTMQESRNER